MYKPVEFTRTASRQLLEKGISETTAVSRIQDTPKDNRDYYEEECFNISFRRKKKWVIFWVREFDYRFLLLKLHTSAYPSIR